MKPTSPLSAPYRNSAGDADRRGHRRGPFVATCEAILGFPDCIGQAVRNECTELLDIRTLLPVSEMQHLECEARGWDAYRERNGSPCDDCAMRPGSPEMRDRLSLTVALQRVPFRCHQGMPLRYYGKRDDDGAPKVSYEPREMTGSTYPPCNGWAYFRALGDDEGAIDALAEVAG